ncbi:MAG TPA: alpha/beta hydrolase [Burkholderiaceae bacterium]|nr:alpha/beta hydrolase [Burkholderiaceae bacterium]
MAIAALVLLCGTACTRGAGGAAAELRELKACRLPGVEREARCGEVEVPENPDRPEGRQLRIAFTVVPATAAHKSNDAVLVLAGGPGQSAIASARQIWPLFDELSARRDIVFVDQRGTGRSNGLNCQGGDRRPTLGESADSQRERDRLARCRDRLTERADLAQYATWIAVRDFDRVRERLGYERINLWGGSYGTRAALEYARQFPTRVRTLVLDGVAPADMVLPVSFAVDADAAFTKLADACRTDAACARQTPDLLASIDALLAREGANARVTVTDPYFGLPTTLSLDRAGLAPLLRAPLYAPSLAAVLPYAVEQARAGDLSALMGLATALSEVVEGEEFGEGMHYSVICAEDMTRLDSQGREAAMRTRSRDAFISHYEQVCAQWPKRPAPNAFFTIPKVDAPVLLLSGGFDPATPPRHADRVARALPRATHVVAPNLGHLVSPQACASALVRRFIREGDASGLDASCLQRIPAPWFYTPPRPKDAAP